MLQRSQSLFEYCNVFKSKIGIQQDHGSHTPLQDEGEWSIMDLASSLQTRYDYTVDSETLAQKQKRKRTVVSVNREHRDGCSI